MEVIDHYFYTKEHEWINIEDGIGTIGISEYAQSSLGDVTFVELPEEGATVEQFEEICSVESVKAASDIYSPMAGEIIEVNTELEEEPGMMNQYCYSKGWIAKIKISDEEETENLMTAEEYRSYLESVDH